MNKKGKYSKTWEESTPEEQFKHTWNQIYKICSYCRTPRNILWNRICKNCGAQE